MHAARFTYVMPVLVKKLREKRHARLLTAGALWTALDNEHDNSFRSGVAALAAQIRKIAASIADDEGPGSPSSPPPRSSSSSSSTGAAASSSSSSPLSPRIALAASTQSDLRHELDTLREEVSANFARAAQSGGEDAHLAHLPAEVPALNDNFRATPDVQRLKTLLMAVSDGGTQGGGGSNILAVSSASKSTVGAHGMGGIGKTVRNPLSGSVRHLSCICQALSATFRDLTRSDTTAQIMAAFVARDVDIRRHFDGIVWVTLSQDPDISKLQQLFHLQLTGSEMPPNKSSEEVKELLTQAARERRVLLILDDCWRREHGCQFSDCLELSNGSKTLVTTRICGLLQVREKSSSHARSKACMHT
jgi:hypothetical protein